MCHDVTLNDFYHIFLWSSAFFQSTPSFFGAAPTTIMLRDVKTDGWSIEYENPLCRA
jgi:hypothetical protein